MLGGRPRSQPRSSEAPGEGVAAPGSRPGIGPTPGGEGSRPAIRKLDTIDACTIRQTRSSRSIAVRKVHPGATSSTATRLPGWWWPWGAVRNDPGSRTPAPCELRCHL